MKLKDIVFQQKSISEVCDHVSDWIETDVFPKTLILEAGSGSGKTYQFSQFSYRIHMDIDKNTCFIYACIRSIPEQSKQKVDSYHDYLGQGGMRTTNMSNEVYDNMFHRGEILFTNWEKTVANRNVLTRYNENGYYLQNFIKNTRAAGIKIILVIDEFHHSSRTKKAKDVIDIIKPDIIIKMSATPEFGDPFDAYVKVPEDDVRSSGLITKETIINGGISSDDLVNETFAIDQGIARIKMLKDGFEAVGADVNPMLLIKIPSGTDEETKKVKIFAENRCTEHGFTYENGLMALDLSGKKINIENMKKNNSPQRVLLFKEVIRTGWDCPRSKVLTDLTKSSKALPIDLQLAGRIIRTVEQKFYPEEYDFLNKSYIYHTSSEVSVVDGNLPHPVSMESYRNPDEDYENMNLKSYFRPKNSITYRSKFKSEEYTRLFKEEAKKYNLKDKLIKEESKIISPLSVDGIWDAFGRIGKIKQKTSYNTITDTLYIESLYKDAILVWAGGIGGKRESVAAIKSIHRTYFNKEIGFSTDNLCAKVQNVILSHPENIIYLTEVHNAVNNRYKINIKKERREIQEFLFKIPKTITHVMGPRHEIMKNHLKSVMQPLCMYDPTDPERGILMSFERNPYIKRYFKNSTKGKEIKYFSMDYENTSFYPDFEVDYVNGFIGLYDTKGGQNIWSDETRLKAERLHKYIKEEGKHKKLHGGILVNINSIWHINSCERYIYDKEYPPGLDWEMFNDHFCPEENIVVSSKKLITA
jgi:type III restriction enzyme